MKFSFFARAKVQTILNRWINNQIETEAAIDDLLKIGNGARDPLAQIVSMLRDSISEDDRLPWIAAALALHRLGDDRGMKAMFNANDLFLDLFSTFYKFLVRQIEPDKEDVRLRLEEALVGTNTATATVALSLLAFRQPEVRIMEIAKMLAEQGIEKVRLLHGSIAAKAEKSHDELAEGLAAAALALFWLDRERGLKALFIDIHSRCADFLLSQIPVEEPAVRASVLAIYESGNEKESRGAFHILGSRRNPEGLQFVERALIDKEDYNAIGMLTDWDLPDVTQVASRVLKIHAKDDQLCYHLIKRLIKMGCSVDVDALCDSLDYSLGRVMYNPTIYPGTAMMQLPDIIVPGLRVLVPSGHEKSERLITSLTKALVVGNHEFRRDVEQHLLAIGSEAVPVMERLCKTPDETWSYGTSDRATWDNADYFHDEGIAPPLEAVEEIKHRIKTEGS